jgi:threonine dehydrogenase-like Zn-dependent dehydrogenase
MGHEFCGRVVQAPADSSSNLKVGQAVMVDPRLCWGSCVNCQSLNTNGCAKWGFLGLSGGGGGLSETVAVDASMCHVLPESVPLELAALIEPLSVAHHAAICADVQDWSIQSVLCGGGGPVAIAVVMILRAQGVGKVFFSEPRAKRREHAVEIADAVINPVKESVGQRCRSLTNGRGVDVVFDCAGVQVGLEAGMDALVFGGICVNVAGWETPVYPGNDSKGICN